MGPSFCDRPKDSVGENDGKKVQGTIVPSYRKNHVPTPCPLSLISERFVINTEIVSNFKLPSRNRFGVMETVGNFKSGLTMFGAENTKSRAAKNRFVDRVFFIMDSPGDSTWFVTRALTETLSTLSRSENTLIEKTSHIYFKSGSPSISGIRFLVLQRANPTLLN